MTPRKEAEWAWLAGIFEGEGCIEFHGANSVCLAVSMTDQDVVDRCLEVAEVGYIQKHSDRPGKKRCWRWRVQTSGDVELVLDNIEEFLGKRRWARVQEARVRLSKVRRAGFCKRGHEMSGDNLYTAPGSGHTSCRTCHRERQRAWQKKNNPPFIKGTTKQCAECGVDFVTRTPNHKYCDDHSEWSKRKEVV